MRELVRFTSDETRAVAAHLDGESFIAYGDETKPLVAGLRPGLNLDFIKVSESAQMLVVSDVPLLEAFPDAEFIPVSEVLVDTASWALPLTLPAILERSLDNDQILWSVLENLAGRYLEQGAWADHTKPWKDGQVAAIVRANWDVWKKRGLVQGESHWGWIKGKYFRQNGGESWGGVKGKFEGYMRAADVFLRNVHEREWIRDLTLNEIIEIPISRAIRCCGAIGRGVFSRSGKLRAALFNPEIPNRSLNHIISEAELYVPVREVNKETGEINLVVPATGEVLPPDTDESTVVDEYLPPLDTSEGLSSPVPKGTHWTYDWEQRQFGYWEYGTWHPSLSVLRHDDTVVERFVDEIIAKCRVSADYSSYEMEEEADVRTSTN